jgi:hypothetical protein
MDAPGISPQHLIGVMDAGLASLPGRHASGYDRTAQAIIAAGKRRMWTAILIRPNDGHEPT